MLSKPCFSLLCLLIAITQAKAGPVKVRLQDAICVPGKPVRLTAEVSSQITLSLKSSKANVPVEFFADGRSLGRATTNSQGFAVLEMRPGLVEGSTYTAQATYKRQMLRGAGRWFNWEPDRTVIAVDIDDTVCRTNYGDLFLSDLDHVSPPLDGAAEALTRLSKRFYILYFSARPLWLTDKTRVWLSDNGFPAGPVMHKGGWDSCLRQEAVKEELLTSLRPLLPNLLIGIADRDVDCRAFGSHGIVTMLVRNRQLARANRRAVGFSGWRQLDRFFAEHEAQLANATTLAMSIAQNRFPPLPVPARGDEESAPILTDASGEEIVVQAPGG